MVDWPWILEQHGPLVWQTVYRLVGHGPDAADCFQNTFVAALEVARREAVRHWPAMLKRLATVQSLDCLRQRMREAGRRQALIAEPKAPTLYGPEQAARQAELADELRRALADLEPRQAQIFCLACLDGWSYQDLAEHLEIRVNHVGVLLNRARTALRERLRAFDPAGQDNKMGEQS